MELSNSIVRTPETETETSTGIQPTRPASSSNGVLKLHAPLHHHHHPVVVTFKECLKNFAAARGGHSLDGCGEFLPSPTSNPSNPHSLICAVCGCHRNFHRRETEEFSLPVAAAVPGSEYHSLNRHHPTAPPPPPGGNSSGSLSNSPSPPPISSSYYPSAPHLLMALSHASGPPGSNQNPNPPISGNPIKPNSTPLFNSGRKRFRTKFTQDQKGKMLEFAEKVGWKMQKRDENAINEFCGEIGVEKGVFKVWMHNNKNTAAKKEHHQQYDSAIAIFTPPPVATGNSNGVNFSYQLDRGNGDCKQAVNGPEMGRAQNYVGTNGSSSS